MEEKIRKDNVELVVVRTDNKRMEIKGADYIEAIFAQLS